MPVQVQSTPNPNALKFVLPRPRFDRPMSFPSAAAAAAHPLAAAIFALDGVYNVFMVQDFVTVNKRPEIAWSVLTPQIQSVIDRYID